MPNDGDGCAGRSEQDDEVVGPAATRGLPTDNKVAVRPGDSSSAAEVEGWLWDYAAGRDPHLRERIILAYLGLADRPAARYRTSRGVTLEDLTQAARAGLIAVLDRHEPGRRDGFVPFAVACVVRELKRYLAGYQLGSTSLGRSRTNAAAVQGG